jgi:hypothetical protein
MSVGKTSSPVVNRGQLKLSAPETTTLTTIGQYYQINGVFTDGSVNNFTLAADGTLTYHGPDCAFLMNGSSDYASDKTAEVTYGLYLNGVLAPGAETPHDFDAANKTENIAINVLVDLTAGDYINVYAKSDSATTVISLASLIVTFYGVCGN